MKQMTTPPADIPYIDRHRAVVNSKTSTVKGEINQTKLNLLGLDNNITNRYVAFEESIANNTLFEFPENVALQQHKDDLLSCYIGHTARVKDIFTLIKDSQPSRFLKKCPYCGITLPKTHDHYLPEARYPELAVHVLNLIPCCGSCNQVKSAGWKNESHRTFIHFYSDQLPSSQYLLVTLRTNNTDNALGATFSLHQPQGIDTSIWNIITAHYNKLKLIEQYNEIANDEIAEILEISRAYLCEGGTNISGFLNRIITNEEALYGCNHWRVALMKALSSSNQFITAVEAAN